MIKFVAVLLAFLYSGASLAASATVHSLTGNVTAALGEAAPTALTKGSALESGMSITTGDNSNIIMKFEDGQVVVLNANTTFKITRYQFNATQPQNGSAFFSLVKGAMRSISGLIGKHNSGGFQLQTPNATIGIRGTDFMVALVNPAFLSVIQGVISTTNTAGTAVFGAGTTGMVASTATLGVAIPVSALPGSVAASFSSLSSAAVSAGVSAASSTGGGTAGTASGGATATGGTAATGAAVGGGLSTTAVVGTVAAVGAVAAALNNKTPTAAAVTATVTTP